MNKSVDFAHGSVEKAILLQAGPLLIAQLIQLLYNVVDRIYIGHIAGSDGLALTGSWGLLPTNHADHRLYGLVCDGWHTDFLDSSR